MRDRKRSRNRHDAPRPRGGSSQELRQWSHEKADSESQAGWLEPRERDFARPDGQHRYEGQRQVLPVALVASRTRRAMVVKLSQTSARKVVVLPHRWP